MDEHGPTRDGARRAVRPDAREQLAWWVAAGVAAAAALAYPIVALAADGEAGAGRPSYVLAGIVLALAAFARFLPAGLRASLALVTAVACITAGAVALSGALRGSQPAAAVTVVLLLPAGLVLLALGAWLLWASRKRGGPLWWTVARRALLAVAGLFVVFWLVLPVSLAVVATERPREAVTAPDFGAPHEGVTLHTGDGVTLNAWYVRPRNGAAVILFPRTWTAAHARMLVRNGYGVLLVDKRGYGDSGGSPNAYGWGSVRDIDAAVAWLRERPEVRGDAIGGLGLSVGGEQMIEAAAGNEDLRAVVSEGAGWRSARESLARAGPNSAELALQYPHDVVLTAAVWLLSGEDVLSVPYYRAAGEPKELWAVRGAGHTGGLRAQPAEYERRVVAFFDRHLLSEEQQGVAPSSLRASSGAGREAQPSGGR